MKPSELRASLALSGIFALRMLGLFLILPIFSLHAKGLEHGDNATLVGLTMGIYGMVQAFLHIPLGILSDRIGRRKVVVGGLLLFIGGALVAAMNDNIYWILVGRAIQGAGAISAAITAWVADLTREEIRTRAMAMIGGSIAVSFAIAIVIAAPLYHLVGMQGIFLLMAVFGLLACFVVYRIVPESEIVITPAMVQGSQLKRFAQVLQNPELVRLNIGVLILHASQVAMFLAIPRLLVAIGYPLELHWRVYLLVLTGSILVMAPMLMRAEKKHQLALLMKVAVGLLFLSMLYFFAMVYFEWTTLWAISGGLWIFFIGFNLMESLQPSLVSRFSGDQRGAGLGIYNTTMSIGLFLGGLIGGWLYSRGGAQEIFMVDALMMALWLIITLRMAKIPPKLKTPTL